MRPALDADEHSLLSDGFDPLHFDMDVSRLSRHDLTLQSLLLESNSYGTRRSHHRAGTNGGYFSSPVGGIKPPLSRLCAINTLPGV